MRHFQTFSPFFKSLKAVFYFLARNISSCLASTGKKRLANEFLFFADFLYHFR